MKNEDQNQLNNNPASEILGVIKRHRENAYRKVNEDDIPMTRILDQYSLEFLDLPNNYLEKDLRKAIVRNLKDFILEIGKETHARWNAMIRFRAFLIDKEALCPKIRG